MRNVMCGLAVVAGAIFVASSAHSGPSSFQRSCSDIRIEFANDEVTISASCRDKSGRTQPADFSLSGYHNIDGKLVFNGRGKGSFHKSCQNDKLDVRPDRVVFSSDCKTRNQSVRRATIEIQDIQNIDGKLVRLAQGAQPVAPPPPAVSAPAPPAFNPPQRNAPIDWVRSTPGAPMDPRAKPAGTMADGLGVFPCIGEHNGGVHPGTAGIWIEGCSIGFGGREFVAKSFSVMLGSGRWVAASGGILPPRAHGGGHEANGAVLYVCRVRQPGAVFVGKTRPGFNGCNYTDQGQERTAARYDVLTE